MATLRSPLSKNETLDMPRPGPPAEPARGGANRKVETPQGGLARPGNNVGRVGTQRCEGSQ
jgi:hypothetical protein